MSGEEADKKKANKTKKSGGGKRKGAAKGKSGKRSRKRDGAKPKSMFSCCTDKKKGRSKSKKGSTSKGKGKKKTPSKGTPKAASVPSSSSSGTNNNTKNNSARGAAPAPTATPSVDQTSSPIPETSPIPQNVVPDPANAVDPLLVKQPVGEEKKEVTKESTPSTNVGSIRTALLYEAPASVRDSEESLVEMILPGKGSTAEVIQKKKTKKLSTESKSDRSKSDRKTKKDKMSREKPVKAVSKEKENKDKKSKTVMSKDTMVTEKIVSKKGEGGEVDMSQPRQRFVLERFVRNGSVVTRWEYEESHPVGSKRPSFREMMNATAGKDSSNPAPSPSTVPPAALPESEECSCGCANDD